MIKQITKVKKKCSQNVLLTLKMLKYKNRYSHLGISDMEGQAGKQLPSPLLSRTCLTFSGFTGVYKPHLPRVRLSSNRNHETGEYAQVLHALKPILKSNAFCAVGIAAKVITLFHIRISEAVHNKEIY